MNTAFFASVRNALYGCAMNQAQVDSLNAIGQAWEQYGDGDACKLAYILATAHHETGAFKWMREIWEPTTAQNRYEGRADLGNNHPGDGKKFMGPGFVQFIGRRNYQDWSQRTGLNLIKEPQLVQEPAVAARILVQGSMLGTFTGKKLGDFIWGDPNRMLLSSPPQPGGAVDFRGARRVTNGTDKADLIAGYASRFLAALQASKMGSTLQPSDGVDAPSTTPSSPIPTLPLPATVKRGIPGWVWFAAAAVIAVAA